jgi:hypothetical protein
LKIITPRRMLLAFGTAAGVLTLAAAPAMAGTPVADMKVASKKAGPYLGNNVYTGTNVDLSIDAGENKSRYLKVQNDGNAKGTWTLHGPASDTALKFRWFKGDKNITGAVAFVEGGPNPGYEFSVKPGKTKSFRWVVKRPASASTASRCVLTAVRVGGEQPNLDTARLDINNGCFFP